MGLQNRKLIDSDAPIGETLDKFCKLYCDAYGNHTFCPSPCSAICPTICNDDSSSLYPSPTSASRSSFDTNKLFIVSFSLLALTLVALFCYAFYYKRFRRSGRPQQIVQTRDEFLDEDHGPVLDHPIWYINTVGLPAAVIDSIAVFKYRKGDGLLDGTDCSVCLGEFQEDETLRLLPKCSHAFHISCIDTWLRSHTNCPMCRAPIAAAVSASVTAEAGGSSGTAETRVDIPREAEAEHGQSPGVENGGAERRGQSLDSSEASKMGQAASEESNPEAKKVGRSQSVLRLVGSSLQRPVFLKRSVSCYGDFSFPTEDSSSSPS